MSTTENNLATTSYYRSQLYTAYLGVNPLVSAAHPIFSLVERFSLSGQLVLSENLSSIVKHELHAFETRAYDANYDAETIMISRYLLTSVLHHSLKQHKLNLKLLNSSTDKGDKHSGEDNFLKISERIITKPDIYLDLLELSYLCLSTGYRGSNDKEKEKYETLKDKLFNTIYKHRHFEKENESTPPPVQLSPEPSPPSHGLLKALGLGLLITTLVLVAGNAYLNYEANHYINLNDKGTMSSSWTN